MDTNPYGKNPNDILNNQLVDISTWHFFQARSWLDYATRESKPSAIQYASFELRYGIEYLLFELLVVSSETLTEKEYKEYISDRSYMKKKLGNKGSNYEKLSRFTQILESEQSSGITLRFWNIGELNRFWGNASDYLHFSGTHSYSLWSDEWFIKAVSELDSILSSIWENLEGTHGAGVLKPSKMWPEIRSAWDEFLKGDLTEDDLRTRARILFPLLQTKYLR